MVVNLFVCFSETSSTQIFEGDMLLTEEQIQAAENGMSPNDVGGARGCQSIVNGLEESFLILYTAAQVNYTYFLAFESDNIFDNVTKQGSLH